MLYMMMATEPTRAAAQWLTHNVRRLAERYRISRITLMNGRQMIILS
jgi:hypothetical protein